VTDLFVAQPEARSNNAPAVILPISIASLSFYLIIPNASLLVVAPKSNSLMSAAGNDKRESRAKMNTA
jgi:hypothetical protein